jgi:hypothetical protein
MFTDDYSVLLDDDDSGAGVNPELYRVVLAQTRTYHVLVQPVPDGGTGTFRLRIDRETPLSLDDGPQTVAFNSKWQPDLTFTGHAGENVTLQVRVPHDATAYKVDFLRVEVYQNGEALTVISRGGGQQPPAQGDAGDVSILSTNVSVPADGPVTVRVYSSGELGFQQGYRLDVAVER